MTSIIHQTGESPSEVEKGRDEIEAVINVLASKRPIRVGKGG